MSFDFIVIGSGPGGYQAAIRAAHRGASVALVEESHLGGVCLNRGCIPTKGMVTSMEVLRAVRQARDFGVEAGEARISLAAVVDRRNQVVARIQQGLQFLLQKNRIEVVRGRGRLAGGREVEVGGKRFKAGKIILAAGSHPAGLPIAPADGVRILTSDHSLDLTEPPESMIILGGGYIGCEYASIFSQLGARVTVVEALDRLLPLMDADLGKQLERSFKKQGITVRTGAKAEATSIGASGVKLSLAGGETLEASKLLVSVGRSPNLDGLGLEREGVKYGRHVEVSDFMETSAAGIYAIGDLVGRFPLAHVASAQARVAVDHAFGGGARMDYRVVPSAVFTYPELASVGLSEQEASGARPVRVSKFPLAAIGKAVSQGETEGFVKLVADAGSGELLGAHLAGLHAAELVGVLAVALQKRMTARELSETIFTHPTYGEAIAEAAEMLAGQAVHLPPPPRKS